MYSYQYLTYFSAILFPANTPNGRNFLIDELSRFLLSISHECTRLSSISRLKDLV